MSHTKGQWKIHPALADGANHVRICAGVEEVARVGSIDHPWAQTVADARLIALAPEMLEFCKRVAYRYQVLCNGLVSPEMYADYREARDFINKATGAQEDGQ